MNEWNIQSRSRSCQLCEKSFVDKEHYHTLLLTNRHEMERMDVCIPCWESKYAGQKEERKNLISQWKGVYHAPAAAAVTEPIQKESAETLLRKLIETNDPKHGPACFILAVMLERKRLLKVKEQIKRDGNRIFVYEHPGSGDLFTIKDPNLQLTQLESVQRDVADLLVNGLPAAPEAVPAPTAAPTLDDQTEAQPEVAEASAEVSGSTEAPVTAEAPSEGDAVSSSAAETGDIPASNDDSQNTSSSRA